MDFDRCAKSYYGKIISPCQLDMFIVLTHKRNLLIGQPVLAAREALVGAATTLAGWLALGAVDCSALPPGQ